MSEAGHIQEQELEALHEEAFRWALSCCHYDPDRAGEVMQNSYLEILEGRAVFHGKSSLRTWLFALIRNQARQQGRKLFSVHTLKQKLATFRVDENTISPFSHLDSHRTSEQVFKCICSLPFKQKQIIELVYYRGFTIAEAGLVMGVSLGAARTHLHRAKKNLETKLKKPEEN